VTRREKAFYQQRIGNLVPPNDVSTVVGTSGKVVEQKYSDVQTVLVRGGHK
jgi:hypothetical protein